MAKKSMIAREARRTAAVDKYAAKREALKEIIRNPESAFEAVMEAVEKGDIDRDSYENYLKMLKEQERFTTTVAEKRRKEKNFGKILKDYHRIQKKNQEE